MRRVIVVQEVSDILWISTMDNCVEETEEFVVRFSVRSLYKD